MKLPDTQTKNRMPLYLQLAKVMRQKIEHQEWRYGEQIPTLERLGQEYGVSRITLRAALTYLEGFGIVRRIRGQGTFVIKDLSQERWYKLANTFDELVRKVSNLNVQLLQIEQSERPPVPAFPFGQVGKAYRCLKRVHSHAGEPYCVIELYLEKSIFERDPQQFSTSPAIAVLASLPGIRIAGARQVTRIGVANEEAASHLHIGVGEPVADVCRTLTDEDGLIIYYAHIRYPAQMVQIETDLMPNVIGKTAGGTGKQPRGRPS